jgi:hypothetical protein
MLTDGRLPDIFFIGTNPIKHRCGCWIGRLVENAEIVWFEGVPLLMP